MKQVKICLIVILFSMFGVFGVSHAELNANPAVEAKEKKPGSSVKEIKNPSSKTMKVLPVTRDKPEKGKKYYVSNKLSGSLEPKVLTMEGSAYYKPEEGQEDYILGSYEKDKKMNGGGLTSSGTAPTKETVATDKFKPGTVLLILGVGLKKVEDTGGVVVGDKIDLFMGQGDEGRILAKEFGRRQVRVIVISEA